jgi:hypothetical protein
MANAQPGFFGLLRHFRPAIAAKRQGELLADMYLITQIPALAVAERPAVVHTIPTQDDVHNFTQTINRQGVLIISDKLELHLLRSAKNWVAFIGETPRWGLSYSSSV